MFAAWSYVHCTTWICALAKTDEQVLGFRHLCGREPRCKEHIVVLNVTAMRMPYVRA